MDVPDLDWLDKAAEAAFGEQVPTVTELPEGAVSARDYAEHRNWPIYKAQRFLKDLYDKGGMSRCRKKCGGKGGEWYYYPKEAE